MKHDDVERESDRSEVREFSTDQRINMQALSVNKKRLEHQKTQTCLMGLSIQKSAMLRQVGQLEHRSMTRHLACDSRNMH